MPSTTATPSSGRLCLPGLDYLVGLGLVRVGTVRLGEPGQVAVDRVAAVDDLHLALLAPVDHVPSGSAARAGAEQGGQRHRRAATIAGADDFHETYSDGMPFAESVIWKSGSRSPKGSMLDEERKELFPPKNDEPRKESLNDGCIASLFPTARGGAAC